MPDYSSSDKIPGSSTDVVIWSVLEIYTAVICACLMAIRPLLTKYLPALFQSTVASNSNAGYNNSRVHRMDSKSAAAPWSRNHGSAIELKSTESAKVWIDAESTHDVHDGRNGHAGTLEVWVTRSVEQGNNV
jgi:hypothetical protein